jgi:hypothetical protein|tara:strand:- start:2616 stop:3311 length:696 start_codon:yes stop_codon:yes gene_type:complete
MSKFSELSKIDVGEFIEKKGNLSYISWASAWQMLCEQCPDATYEHHEPVTFANGEVMVSCTVTVDGVSHRMHLPVLDHRNKPIQNPSVFQLNTSMQRCFAKAISMHGLGLYIYRGEDLPPTSPYDEAIKAMADSVKFHQYINGLSEEEQNEAFNGAPSGEKTAFKAAWRDLLKEAEELFEGQVDYIRTAIEQEDGSKLAEAWAECTDYEKSIIRNRLSADERKQAKQLLGA